MRVFNEQQRFTQLWLIALMGISILVPIALILKEYLSENSTMSTVEFVTTVALILACILPIFLFKLKTRIDEYGIHYQFFPFHLSFRTISWSEIKSIYTRKYEPIGEYGGWGMKAGWGSKKGKAINISGDLGIQLELTNGKKLLIGTQKESEAKKVIKTYQSKLNNNESA